MQPPPFKSLREIVAKSLRQAILEAIVSAARSSLLKEMLASIWMRIRLVMAATSVSGLGSSQAAAEHQMLVEAIARKDAEAAEQIARRATQEAGKRMLRLISEAAG